MKIIFSSLARRTRFDNRGVETAPFRKWWLALEPLYSLYGWIREWARWSKSCVLIGYTSGQDGPILGFPALVPLETFWRYNESFIDQRVRPRWLSIGLVFIDLEFVSVYKNAQKNLATIQPSRPHAWSITQASYCNKPGRFNHEFTWCWILCYLQRKDRVGRRI